MLICDSVGKRRTAGVWSLLIDTHASRDPSLPLKATFIIRETRCNFCTMELYRRLLHGVRQRLPCDHLFYTNGGAQEHGVCKAILWARGLPKVYYGDNGLQLVWRLWVYGFIDFEVASGGFSLMGDV